MPSRLVVRLIVGLACILWPLAAQAKVSFNNVLFSNGMVLQRNVTAPIWGLAAPGEVVTVTIGTQQKTATADSTGHWTVNLDPMAASGPLVLKAKGTGNTVSLQNVVVGEVWVASGQSNMVIPLVPLSVMEAHPSVRTLHHFGWTDTPSETAFWFAVELSQQLGVTVGIVNRAVSGSGIVSWLGNTVPQDPDPAVQAFFAGRTFFNTNYQIEIATLQPYAIRGVVWWQGETNYGAPGMYTTLFPALIRSWRNEWGQGDYPFLFAQVPKGGGITADDGAPDALPAQPPPTSVNSLMRQAYFLTESALPGTGLLNTLDLPGGLHPQGKDEYGERFGLLALGSVYGQDISTAGPILQSACLEGNVIRLRYVNNTAIGLYSLGGGPLQGFAVGSGNTNMGWANAQIDGDTVVLSANSIPRSALVRYAWGALPTWANLFSQGGLSAAPFSVKLGPGPAGCWTTAN
jgi:sialate O-acetylesterase